MFRVIVNDNPPPPRTDEQRGYDVGFGRATMDRCSGEPPRNLDGIAETDYNAGYVNGYLDGYCSNEDMTNAS